MKISDLPSTKGGLSGSLLQGMKNLGSHTAFPELVLKRANDVKTAVNYGGIFIEFTGGACLFFACPDAQQLLDTEITEPRAADIQLKLGSPFYTRDDGLSFFRIRLMADEVSSANPKEYVLSEVVRWCAVLTPCAGYGHSGISNSSYLIPTPAGLSVSIGSIQGDGSVSWGTGGSQVEAGGTSSALVLWREVPLRKTLGQIASREGFLDDLVRAYPGEIRDEAKDAAVGFVNSLSKVPLCQIFSYTRGLGDIDGHFGVGLANPFTYRSTGGARTAVQVYGSKGLPESGNSAGRDWTEITDSVFDCGFRSLCPNGKRQWNRLSTPRPQYGWKMTNGVIPTFVTIDDTKVSTRGLLRDFLPLATTANLDLRLSGETIPVSGMPSLAWGRDTENHTGKSAVDTVATLDPVQSEDYLTHMINVLARVDAELGDGDTFHRTSTRVWQASAVERASYAAPVRYILQFPGSKWSGSSKAGGRLEFSAVGKISVTSRKVRYAGLDYLVLDVMADGKFFR